MDAFSRTYPVPDAVVASTVRCDKERACLAHGPKCRVVGTLNAAEALIVCCQELGACAYKTGNYLLGGERRTVCSCPLRVAFHRLHGL